MVSAVPEVTDLDEVIQRGSTEVSLKQKREGETEEHKGTRHEQPKKSEKY